MDIYFFEYVRLYVVMYSRTPDKRLFVDARSFCSVRGLLSVSEFVQSTDSSNLDRLEPWSLWDAYNVCYLLRSRNKDRLEPLNRS
jgi:hypothetical protein